MLLLWLLAPAAVLGVVLLALGVRGWRRGSFPGCRRCGFDLSGRREGDAESDRHCPECGADLSKPRAMARGARRRRPAVALAGGLLVLFAGGYLASVAFGGPGVHRLKPLGLILFETRFADATLADELGAELQRRESAAIFPVEQADRIIAALLDVQRDRARVWSPRYGDLIESLGMTPEQNARYDRQMLGLEVVARERVSLGSPIPVAIRITGIRSGANSIRNLSLMVHRPTVNGAPASFLRGRFSGPPGSPFSVTNIRVSPYLTPGPVLVLVEPSEPFGTGFARVGFAVYVASGTEAITDEGSIAWRLMEAGPVKLVEGATAVVDADASITVESTGSEPIMTVFTGSDAAIPPYLSITQVQADAPLAHRLVLVAPDGTETAIGWYTGSASVRSLPEPGYVTEPGWPRLESEPGFMDRWQPVFAFSQAGVGGIAASLGSVVNAPDGTRAVLRPDSWFAELTLDVYTLPEGEIDLGKVAKQTR